VIAPPIEASRVGRQGTGGSGATSAAGDRWVATLNRRRWEETRGGPLVIRYFFCFIFGRTVLFSAWKLGSGQG
jgi:hypothetical protein